MLFNLFKSQPLLDNESVEWLFSMYEWALNNFGADIFFQQTTLVAPTNQFFPGQAENNAEMAQLIFDKVREYAGLKHWPCRLVTEQSCAVQPERMVVAGALRDMNGKEPGYVLEEQRLKIVYDPRQVNNPEAIIATFAHTLAHYLATMAPQMPPGGEENWPQATEVLAVFLGFGLMFANSAFVYRNRSCSSCQPVTVNRQASLSQYDTTYALAIFAVLKKIPPGQVKQHLKKSLRSFFHKAYKDVKTHEIALEKLIALDTQLAIEATK